MPASLSPLPISQRVNDCRFPLYLLVVVYFATFIQAQDDTRFTQLYVPDTTYHLELISVNETKPQSIPTPLSTIPEENVATPLKVITQITQNFELIARKKENEIHVEVRPVGLKASIHTDDQLQAEYDSAHPSQSLPMLQQLFGAGKERNFTLVYNQLHEFVRVTIPEDNDATPLGKQSSYTTRQLAEAFRLLRDGFLPSSSRETDSGNGWKFEHQIQLPPLGELRLDGKATLIPNQEPSSEPKAEGTSKLLPVELEGTLEIASSTAPDATTFTISDAKFQGKLQFDPALHQTKLMETTTKLLVHRPEQPVLQYQQTETLTLKSVTYGTR